MLLPNRGRLAAAERFRRSITKARAHRDRQFGAPYKWMRKSAGGRFQSSHSRSSESQMYMAWSMDDMVNQLEVTIILYNIVVELCCRGGVATVHFKIFADDAVRWWSAVDESHEGKSLLGSHGWLTISSGHLERDLGLSRHWLSPCIALGGH